MAELTGMEGLAKRLDRLEREVRWWRATGGIVVAVATLALLIGATNTSVPNEIRAKRFVVVDDKGAIYAELHADVSPLVGRPGPTLRLIDPTDTGRDAFKATVLPGLVSGVTISSGEGDV